MLHETVEEGSLVIRYDGDLKALQVDYEIKKVPVIAEGFDKIDPKLKDIKAFMFYVGTVKTPELERNADGTKRVYCTTALATLIDLKTVSCTKDDLKKVFQAGDDAGAMYIEDVTADFTSPKDQTLPVVPKFGLPHHGSLFIDMVKTLRVNCKFKLA